MSRFFQNLSLRKSIACYIVFFAALALLLGGATEHLCDQAAQAISAKYDGMKEELYVTNKDGEILGGGAYLWKQEDPTSLADQRALKALDVLRVLAYPLYSAACVLAAAVLFYRNKLKRPLALLADAAFQISENNLDFRLDYPNEDEMGQLCRAFETMRQALAENYDAMWRTMEERKRLNAAFAHDLRTPLTVLKGYNEMTLLTGGPKERETAEIMQKHLLRMEGYTESMSRIRRLEDREADCREVDFANFFAVLEASASVICEKGGKNLRFEKRTVSGSRFLDSELIGQVFDNFLSNAVRYAEEEIQILFQENADGLLLTVRDDGGGFSPKGLKNAAEPYYRETEGQTEANHFGLGLYICKILCRQHGGWLKIQNGGSGGEVTAFFREKEVSNG
ncbi:MAG: HAMP domain-containing sensor histidine kinase [Eubacteriales bacterium]|nr:HAMP domain-containing sensor histidine kinase [Eubacteriales bacterium]